MLRVIDLHGKITLCRVGIHFEKILMAYMAVEYAGRVQQLTDLIVHDQFYLFLCQGRIFPVGKLIQEASGRPAQPVQPSIKNAG